MVNNIYAIETTRQPKVGVPYQKITGSILQESQLGPYKLF